MKKLKKDPFKFEKFTVLELNSLKFIRGGDGQGNGDNGNTNDNTSDNTIDLTIIGGGSSDQCVGGGRPN